MSALLSIQHLSIRFTQYEKGLRQRVIRPVSDMSLDANEGEVVALVGASGAGKSLLGAATLGILPPNASLSGRILFDGEELTAQRQRALAGRVLSLLPQSVSFLDPLATVGRQMRRAAKLAVIPDPAAAARAALRDRGLDPDVARLYPFQLSGGMARRVLTALATMGNPRLVFADEPTPGLHPESVAETLASLRGLADRGCALVLVTHDLTTALRIADRVVVCHEGHTLEQIDSDAFSGNGSRLQHPYSRMLWRAMPENGFVLPPSAELEASVADWEGDAHVAGR